ncbi:MAG: dNTP triphosphohydrolase [Akkermansia sp.]|nr:dNTP triphosphohydrolase [Akkermansia sp.]
MDWHQLLSTQRLSEQRNSSSTYSSSRSVFNQDYGRVLYSSAFRRLQDKTQVFPLGRNDYVRTRLTHSLEVSNVGRQLAIRLQKIICEKEECDDKLCTLLRESGDIVSTACLAHDIGNPPFGHFGESAIEHAVRKLSGKDDYTFEGNAQGFRILVKTGDAIKGKGLDLTCATLGAYVKYPCGPLSSQKGKNGIYSKHGINLEEMESFRKVAEECGLYRPDSSQDTWARHPLALLMEAADDISYLVADLEDAYISNIISYDETIEHLFSLGAFSSACRNKVEDEKRLRDEDSAVRYARAIAVGCCIEAVDKTLHAYYSDIMNGTFNEKLMTKSELATPYKSLGDFSKKKIYSHESVIKVELTGYNVIEKLIELYMEWVDNPNSPAAKRISKLLHPNPTREDEYNYRFNHMIDYVSGMTDSYALKTYVDLFGCNPVF